PIFTLATIAAACAVPARQSNDDVVADAGVLDAAAAPDVAPPPPPEPDPGNAACGSVRLNFKDVCTGGLADRFFRNALCTCEGGIVIAKTDSYDSALGAATTLSGAPVGLNADTTLGDANGRVEI